MTTSKKDKPSTDAIKVQSKPSTKPKIVLGSGRYLAEIDYDALFDLNATGYTPHTRPE